MKNNKMPGMPNLNSDGEDSSSSISPIPAFAESGAGLVIPDHKPMFNTVESNNVSVINAAKILRNGIEVKALRNGFYNLHRLRENDVFTVKSFEDLGEWMKCLDPDLEKQHQANMKEKKAKK